MGRDKLRYFNERQQKIERLTASIQLARHETQPLVDKDLQDLIREYALTQRITQGLPLAEKSTVPSITNMLRIDHEIDCFLLFRREQNRLCEQCAESVKEIWKGYRELERIVIRLLAKPKSSRPNARSERIQRSILTLSPLMKQRRISGNMIEKQSVCANRQVVESTEQRPKSFYRFPLPSPEALRLMNQFPLEDKEKYRQPPIQKAIVTEEPAKKETWEDFNSDWWNHLQSSAVR